MTVSALQAHKPSAISRKQLIREAILEKIISGEWPAETRVPSESELIKHFSVSRMTVHHALRTLQSEGYLTRVQGMGTFVARPRSHNTIIRLYNVAEEVRSRGCAYRLELLESERRLPTAAEASLFRMPKHSFLYSLLIRHFEDEHPIQLERRLVNAKASPDLLDQDFQQVTPFDYLMKQYPYPDGRHVVRAVVADNEEAKLLDLEPGSPCLEIERTTWIDDLVINHVVLHYPADRYEIAGDISRSQMMESGGADT